MSAPLKRSLRHSGLLGALLGTVAITAALAVGTGGLLDLGADAATRAELAGRSGSDLALRLSLPLAADAAGQDATIRQVIARGFATADAPIAVDRAVTGHAVLASGGVVGGGTAVAISLSATSDRVEIVSGRWPGESEVAMHADAATALGLAPGAAVVLDEAPFELVGTWRVLDPLDPRWLGDRLSVDGSSARVPAVMIVPETEWRRLDAEPRAEWTLVPDTSQASSADLTTIPAAWSRLPTALRGALGGLGDLERAGHLSRTADEIAQRIAGLRAVEPVALLLISAIAVVAIAQLGRVLAVEREAESRLIWSRGESAPALAARGAVEALLVALLGGAIGTAVAFGVLGALGADVLGLAADPAVLIPGVLLSLVASAFAGAALLRSVRPGTASGPAGSSRRRAGGVGALVLIASAATVAVWQLRLYGSPLIPDAGRTGSVDPVMVAAPALTMVAVILLSAVLAPVLGRLADRPRGTASFVGVAVLRSVARRAEVATASTVIVAIAAATIVVAAGYASTWSRSFDRTAQLRAGADLAATTGAPGVAPGALEALSALPGVSAVAALHVETIQVGGEESSLVAVAPDALRELVAPLTSSDHGDVAAAIDAEVPGPTLPSDPERLGLAVEAAGFDRIPEVSLQVQDAHGVLRGLALDQDDQVAHDDHAGLAHYSAVIPDTLRGAPQPLQLLAVEVAVAPGSVPQGAEATWELRELLARTPSGESRIAVEGFWSPHSPDPALPPPLPTPGGHGATIDSRTPRLWLTPSPSSSAAPPPVAVSQPLADRTRLKVGDEIVLRPARSQRSILAVVAAIVPAIPGAPDEKAVLVDLGVVRNSQFHAADRAPAPRTVWIEAEDPVATIAAARELLPANSRFASAADPAVRSALGSAATALAASAVGGILLAGIAAAASARSERRARRGEVALLRSLGATSRSQAAIRRRELGLVFGYGGASGILAGAVVVVTTIGPIARAAVPGAYATIATELGIDLAAAAAGLGALGLLLSATAVSAARRARHDARRPGSPGGLR